MIIFAIVKMKPVKDLGFITLWTEKDQRATVDVDIPNRSVILRIQKKRFGPEGWIAYSPTGLIIHMKQPFLDIQNIVIHHLNFYDDLELVKLCASPIKKIHDHFLKMEI